MRWEQQVQFASLSDIGMRRQNNEDACAARLCADEPEFRRRGHLFLVADGMGGHAVGELASKLAAETVPHSFFKSQEGDAREALHSAILAANQTIHVRGTQNRDFQRMGTTCSALVLSPRGGFVGHVGDSRCYRVRRDRIDQITFDHSLEWELQRKAGSRAGEIDLREHRNIITRSLGPEERVEVDVEGPFPLFPGDIFLLCSDGLVNHLADAEIGAILRELTPQLSCRMLVHLANLRGGSDNCTVVVVRIGDLPANVPPPEPEPPPISDHALGWGWLAAFWAIAMMLAAGLSLFAFGRPAHGIVMTGLAVFGLLIGLTSLLRNRPSRPVVDDSSKTNYWRPYRTAVCKPTADLAGELATLDTELRRSAEEEGWTIDWNAHDEAVSSGTDAFKQKRYAKACRDLARAVDLLLNQMQRPQRAPGAPRPAGGMR